MKQPRCIIEQAASRLARDPELRAVTIDACHQSISFAVQPASAGSQKIESDHGLHDLVDRYDAASPDSLPSCLSRTPHGHPGWCPSCERPDSLAVPKGIRIVPMPGSVLIEKESCPTAPQFWRWRQIPWLIADQDTDGGGHHAHRHDHDHGRKPRQGGHHDHAHADWRYALAAAVLCALAGGAGIALQAYGYTAASLAAFVFSIAAGAWYPAQEVWHLLREGVIDIHFLMLAVAAGAASTGAWQEGAILLFLFSLSGALEAYAMDRTRREISSLFKAAPKQANRIDPDGSEAAIPVEELTRGMRLRVRPGEQFPADAVVVDGSTAADESNLTGEAIPVEKGVGDNVLGGTLNIWGRVDCRVLRPASESSLSKIIRLIQHAQASRAPSQRFTDRFGTPYTYAILAASGLMFFVWWLGFGVPAFAAADGRSAFYYSMTLLVVASPCALVLSIPSAVLAGIAAGARRGVLFRGGAAIEELATVRRIALDKTGTLTTGELRVARVHTVPPGREDALLRVAAALGQNSSHPVSRALARAAVERKMEVAAAADFHSLNGLGLEGLVKDGPNTLKVRLGRRSLFAAAAWAEELPVPPVGATETLVEAGDLRGQILLRDEVRTASRDLLAKLRARSLAITMLTGDRPEAAQAVAAAVGLDDFRAGLDPEGKVRAIRAWSQQGEKVAMVGDGVNDAPSLAAADIGVAMGVRGSDAALEQADVVLMQDRLENVLTAYEISRQARAIIHQNVAFSLAVIVVLVAAALGAAIPLPLGVLGHEGSTVVVVLNSLRLLFIRQPAAA